MAVVCCVLLSSGRLVGAYLGWVVRNIPTNNFDGRATADVPCAALLRNCAQRSEERANKERPLTFHLPSPISPSLGSDHPEMQSHHLTTTLSHHVGAHVGTPPSPPVLCNSINIIVQGDAPLSYASARLWAHSLS